MKIYAVEQGLAYYLTSANQKDEDKKQSQPQHNKWREIYQLKRKSEGGLANSTNQSWTS